MSEKASVSECDFNGAPHTVSSDEILSTYKVDPLLGLFEDRAKEILAKNGPNRLKPPAAPSRLKIFFSQITNAMTIVLIAAMAVSFGTMDWIAAGVIGALVALNVSVGYSRMSFSIPAFSILTSLSEEWKAAKTLSALESVRSLLVFDF